MKRLSTAFILSLLSFASYAQLTSCAQTLRLARSTYDQGRLQEVPSLLAKCIENGFSKQEKVEAYKILCLSYIYLEEPEKADDAMLHLLQTDHYFEINPTTDPAEFIALYNSFRTKPIYRVGVSLGVNASQPNVTNSLATVVGSSSEYKYQIAFQFGLSGELPISELMTLKLEANLQQRNFELTSTHDQGDGDLNVLTANEKQSWINVPLVVQFSPIKSRFNPYIGIGPSVDYLLSSNISATRVRENEASIEAKSFDVAADRSKINISALVSLGGKTRMGGGYIVAEVKYIYGITSITQEKTAYNNQDLYLAYGMPVSLYKLNGVSFTLGYVYNIFNPKKLNRKK